MKKLKYGLFILVALGWFLNWKYYISRFTSEGFALWLACMIAVTLVVFSSIVFIMFDFIKNSKLRIAVRVLWVFLAIYSINATVAGQYWDQQTRNVTDSVIVSSQENSQYWFEYYNNKIKDLQAEYKDLNNWKKESITNLSQRFYYRNTTQTVEERQAEIKTEIEKTEIELKQLTKDNNISAKKQTVNYAKNIYQFYNKDNPEIIQFIFQLMLSIFIELIAPMSLLFFVNISNRDTGYKIDKSKIRHFAIIGWYNIEKNKSNFILSKDNIINMAQKRGVKFTEKDYNYIIKTSIKNKLLKKKDNKYIPYSDFIDSNYFIDKLVNI